MYSAGLSVAIPRLPQQSTLDALKQRSVSREIPAPRGLAEYPQHTHKANDAHSAARGRQSNSIVSSRTMTRALAFSVVIATIVATEYAGCVDVKRLGNSHHVQGHVANEALDSKPKTPFAKENDHGRALQSLTYGTYRHSEEGSVTGELRQWHKITLGFEGPPTSETDVPNPFTFYRLDVIYPFKHWDESHCSGVLRCGWKRGQLRGHIRQSLACPFLS
jgi:hypothetical protein